VGQQETAEVVFVSQQQLPTGQSMFGGKYQLIITACASVQPGFQGISQLFVGIWLCPPKPVFTTGKYLYEPLVL
jgi:hypothetical protein